FRSTRCGRRRQETSDAGIIFIRKPGNQELLGIMSLTEVRPWSGRDGALRRLRAVVGAERISKGVRFSTFVAPLLRGAGQRRALSLPPTSVNDIIPPFQRFRWSSWIFRVTIQKGRPVLARGTEPRQSLRLLRGHGLDLLGGSVNDPLLARGRVGNAVQPGAGQFGEALRHPALFPDEDAELF